MNSFFWSKSMSYFGLIYAFFLFWWLYITGDFTSSGPELEAVSRVLHIWLLISAGISMRASGILLSRVSQRPIHESILYALLFLFNFVLFAVGIIFSTEMWWTYFWFMFQVALQWTGIALATAIVVTLIMAWLNFFERNDISMHWINARSPLKFASGVFALMLWVVSLISVYDYQSNRCDETVYNEDWSAIFDIDCNIRIGAFLRQHGSAEQQPKIVFEEKIALEKENAILHVVRQHIQMKSYKISSSSLSSEVVSSITNDIFRINDNYFHKGAERKKLYELQQDYDDLDRVQRKQKDAALEAQRARVEKEDLERWAIWELKIEYLDDSWNVLMTAIWAPENWTWWSTSLDHTKYHKEKNWEEWLRLNTYDTHKLNIIPHL